MSEDTHKSMNNSEQPLNNEIAERRRKVLELYSKGFTQQEISKELNISQPTVSRDLVALEQLAEQQLKGLAQHAYALALFRVLNSYDALIKAAWRLLEEKKDPRVLPIIVMLNEKFLEHKGKCHDFGQSARFKDKPIRESLSSFEYEDVPSMFELDYGSEDRVKEQGKGDEGD